MTERDGLFYLNSQEKMMNRLLQVTGIVLFILCMLGCASGPKGPAKIKTFDEQVGTGYFNDVRTNVERILTKHQYTIFRYNEDSDRITFETDWRYRVPFDDEVALNIVDAKTQLFITARPRIRSFNAESTLYVVRMRAENHVRFLDTEEFVRVPLSKMLQEYLKKIAYDFKMEFEQGLRVY